jgi:hypothetical protein
MTGSGSATLAFAKEASFLGSLVDSDGDGTPEHYSPGRSPTVQQASLSNQLQRMREAGLVEAANSIAGNMEGALSVSWTPSSDTHSHVRDIIFNDNGGGFTSGVMNTSRWYLAVDFIGGTTERVCRGVTPLEYSLSYEDGQNTVRESVTFAYADEKTNTSTTPSSVTGPTDGSEVPFHGFTFSVDGTVVSKLQSATLTISNISRLQTGPSRTALDAVLAAPETTLDDVAAIYEGPSTLELAYGGSGATSVQSTMSNVAGEIALDIDGTSVATYTLPKLKPNSYDWSDLVNADTDLTEPTSYHVNGGVSVS